METSPVYNVPFRTLPSPNGGRHKHQTAHPVLGVSKPMRALLKKLEKITGYDCNVLLSGESGTGKELLARQIHLQESCAKRPFVAVNCAALPADLVESVLFGHEKGSFTGATDRRIGKFELANGGDIFLDEIGTLPLSMQAKLLRVLETREIERIGGSETIRLNFRVISATNDDLEKRVREGKFREDLYFRLKVVEFKILPLRERREDVKLLLDYFLMMFSKNGRQRKLSREAVRLLESYPWPGNVRELRNLVENLVIFSDGEVIDSEQVAGELSQLPPNLDASQGEHSIQALVDQHKNLKDAVESFEKQVILSALRKNHWSRTKACEYLGITRNMLYRKIDSLGIELEG